MYSSRPVQPAPSHQGSQFTTCYTACSNSLAKNRPSCTEMAQNTMKAVVFDGPHKVSIQDRPVPKRESHIRTAPGSNLTQTACF